MPYKLRFQLLRRVTPFGIKVSEGPTFIFEAFDPAAAMDFLIKLAASLEAQIIVHELECPEDDFCCHLVDKDGLRAIATCRIDHQDAFDNLWGFVKRSIKNLFKEPKRKP